MTGYGLRRSVVLLVPALLWLQSRFLLAGVSVVSADSAALSVASSALSSTLCRIAVAPFFKRSYLWISEQKALLGFCLPTPNVDEVAAPATTVITLPLMARALNLCMPGLLPLLPSTNVFIPNISGIGVVEDWRIVCRMMECFLTSQVSPPLLIGPYTRLSSRGG